MIYACLWCARILFVVCVCLWCARILFVVCVCLWCARDIRVLVVCSYPVCGVRVFVACSYSVYGVRVLMVCARYACDRRGVFVLYLWCVCVCVCVCVLVLLCDTQVLRVCLCCVRAYGISVVWVCWWFARAGGVFVMYAWRTGDDGGGCRLIT